jgi:hypothetical protein
MCVKEAPPPTDCDFRTTAHRDRCTWDYQGDTSNGIHAQCQFGFSCTDVRVLHKKQRPERDFEAGKACFYYPPQLKT